MRGTTRVVGEWGEVCVEWEGAGEALRIRALRLGPRHADEPATAAWVRRPEFAVLAHPARASEDLALLRRCALERLTPFQRRTLVVLREVVPGGRLITYGALAALVDRPRGARAVARVLAANPFPLVCPCHRVVAAGGRLGGFMAGAPDGPALKRALLAAEGLRVVGDRVPTAAVIA